jgi:hypothetical protein
MKATELIQKLSQLVEENGIDFEMLKTHKDCELSEAIRESIGSVTPCLRCGTPVIEL